MDFDIWTADGDLIVLVYIVNAVEGGGAPIRLYMYKKHKYMHA